MKQALFVALFLPFLLGACSLASDLTPPPGYHPTPVIQPTAAPVVYPLVPPDPAQGAALFTDNCAPCHGDTGMGNGDKASALPNPPAAIGTTNVARSAKPMNWYDIVTNGRIDKFMPPFASLTDRQRWDVIAYVYSLSEPASVVQLGKDAYTASCQSCHGASGRGDGTQAASAGAKVLDWSDPSFLSQRSDQDLYNATTNGIAPGMPAYSSQLTDDQRWAVAAYIRTFFFTTNSGSSAAANAASTPVSTAQAGTQAPTAATGTQAPTGVAQGANPSATSVPQNPTPAAAGTEVVTGKVNINGKVIYTAGGTLPSGLKANLLSYDSMAQVGSISADVKSDGTFSFPNVDVVQGRVWLAQVLYNNVPFSSQPLHDTDIKPGQDAAVSVTISESSTDSTVLSAQRLHVFFDFSVPGVLQVAELFIVQNNTNKAVVAADPNHPALQFQLPAGATGLGFQDGSLGDGRYVQTPNGFGDNQAVPPQGTAQVLFSYSMPYPNDTANVSVPIPMPVDSAVVMVPATGVSVTGPQVTSSGVQNVQGASAVAVFSASTLARGSQLDLTVSGQPTDTSAAAAGATDSGSPIALVIGIAVFGVALAGGGYWLLRQRRLAVEPAGNYESSRPSEPVETAENILDAIVALDDLYQAGELPEEAYKERRAELKTRLKELRG